MAVTQNKSRHRIESIDILKGIGILFMVFAHVGWGGGYAHTYIQAFHMPLFFIVSGYLWKQKDIKSLFKRRFKTLLIPYICFGVGYFVLFILTGHTSSEIANAVKALILYPTDMDHMPFAPALWFLPCMFYVDIIYNFLLDKLGRNKGRIIVLIISSVIIAWSCLSDIMLPFCIEPTGMGLVFWMVGDEIKNHTYYLKSVSDKKWLIIALFFFELILALVNGSCDMRSARYHNLILYLICALIGVFVWYALSVWIEFSSVKTIKFVKAGLLSIGIHSISYLCLNQILITTWKHFFEQSVSNTFSLVMERAGCYLFTMVCCYILDKVIRHTPFKYILGR